MGLRPVEPEPDRNRKFDIESTPKAGDIDSRKKEQLSRVAMASESDLEKGFDAWPLSEFERLEFDRYRIFDIKRPSTAANICYI